MASRVLILGDSVMKGVVFDSLKNRYQLIKDSVVQRFARETQLEITNGAVFGATIEKGEQLLQRRKDTLKDYQYALVEFGGNDCDFDWKAIAVDPQAEHKPKTTIDEFSERYETLIADLRAQGVRPVLMSLPPLDADRFFATISKGLDGNAILSWLGGYKDTIYRWHESYNMAILKLAKKLQTPIVDVRSAFLIRPNYRDYLCEDGMHPNEKGHQLILETFLSFIRERQASLAAGVD